jgi:hypothetical protein
MSREPENPERSGHGVRRAVPEWAALLGVFAAGFLLTFLRRPDALTNPQFFAEDGFWYSQAHELGALRALWQFDVSRAYFYLAPRLAAAAALAFPLRWAPLVMNVLAISIATLPAVVLCSRRYADLMPRLAVRTGVALLTLALPGTWGMIANITNSQWYLGLLGCVVVLAKPDPRPLWRAFDVAALVLLGLSGPLSLFLLPVVAIKWWRRRDRWTIALFGLSAVFAVLQGAATLLKDPTVGGKIEIGATAGAFARLAAFRLVYGPMLGQESALGLYRDGGAWANGAAVALACAVAVALLAAAAWRGPLELRLFVLFACVAYAASLAWPMPLAYTQTYWETLTQPGSGNRYFFLPVLALAFSLVWLALARPVAARAIGVAGLAVAAALGARLDWREPAYRDYGFAEYASKYERAAPGEKVQIPHPPGWGIVLTKR